MNNASEATEEDEHDEAEEEQEFRIIGMAQVWTLVDETFSAPDVESAMDMALQKVASTNDVDGGSVEWSTPDAVVGIPVQEVGERSPFWGRTTYTYIPLDVCNVCGHAPAWRAGRCDCLCHNQSWGEPAK